MSKSLWLSAAVLALGAAGCNSYGSDPAANVGANDSAEALENAAAGNGAAAGNEAAASGAAAACAYRPDDVKEWKAVQGKDGTRTAGMIIVTGKARVEDPKSMAKLDKSGVEGGVLRLSLTRTEQEFPEEVPADGWYDLRYGPGETGIRKVVLRCDDDTDLAELDVEAAQ